MRTGEEGEHLALVSQAATPARLAETLAALANGGGGRVLLGVNPSTGEPEGLTDPDELLDRAVQAALSTEPPLIIPLPRIAQVAGSRVLEVTIPPGLPHVYSYKGRYLARDGTRNRPLAPRQLRRLILERGTVGFEALAPDGATLEDLEWDLVERYVAGLGGWASSTPAELLLRRGCLTRQGSELRPTHAGLLLFGRDPQRWVRSGEILAARYAGLTMDDRFVKEQVRGTLPEQIRRAESFVHGNMRRSVRLVGLERVEETEYPTEAVREAIVNAVAHRDYQIRGDEIRLLLFSDRVEFYSPGHLPGHVTVENLVNERFSRNEIIVQVLSDMGFIERLGYGIDRIIRLIAQAGLPPPGFAETAAGFRVTLYGRGASMVGPAVDRRRWHNLALNERQEAALEVLSQRGRITNRDYQELCPDVSPETIRRDLADLVSQGLLLKIGDKKATYYILK
jgi:ATP-dependent DNA helicase RecG